MQNPAIEIPERKKYPNWKVRPIIKWLNIICPLIWMLGVAFSIDEMTMRFKGRHEDKKRITYKAEGDGFQCDALCQEGYTYQVYMRNDPAPQKYMKQGLSPLHSRVMSLFDSLKDNYHHCAMDNLYNSAAFCKAGYNHDRRVLCHGVTRKGKRGLPDSVVQEQVKNQNDVHKVRGTVKAAVLKNDPDCPDLVASSVYDSKPVHFLSMACADLKWKTQEKDVYNVETGLVESMKFLRMNNNITYNKEMGNVDVADQLRGNYRLDIGVHNRKWWWSMWFWALGVMLVNAYIVYKIYQLSRGVDKKDLLSHHDFRKQIALHWINPHGNKQEDQEASSSTSSRSNRANHSSVSSLSSSSQSILPIQRICTPAKTVKFSKEGLRAKGGKFQVRLDGTVDHIPLPVSKNSKARCQLHRIFGKETQSRMLYCPGCNVHLCAWCYHPYHNVEDLDSIKKDVLKPH